MLIRFAPMIDLKQLSWT